MSGALPKPWTVEDFLTWEARQTERHELVDGVVVAMGGGTLAHATIRDNVTGLLRAALRGTPCRVFSETVKVVTPVQSTYPDIVVTCAEVTMTDDRVPEPRVIVEVLSRSTADRDRGAKWVGYQEVPSLAHYVLIAQDERRVDCLTRTPEGWLLTVIRAPEADLPLSALGVRLPLDAIYADSGV